MGALIPQFLNNGFISTYGEYYANAVRHHKWCLKELEALPRGGLVIRQREGNRYVYARYRVDSTVEYRYIGVEGSEAAQKMEAVINRRDRFKMGVVNSKGTMKVVKALLKPEVFKYVSENYEEFYKCQNQ